MQDPSIANPVRVPTETRPLSVAFILLPEFTLYAFSSFIEVLRVTADRADHSHQVHCKWTITGHDLAPVRASCGIRVAPWELFVDPDTLDYLVVVGGLVRGHREIHPQVFEYLRHVGRTKCNIAGLCTGSFALAEAGLLTGHRTSVHWFHEADFRSRFPHLELDRNTLFSSHDRVSTCSGGRAVADLAAHIVAQHHGINAAHKAMSALGLHTFRQGRDTQSHKGVAWFSKISDPLVRKAILVMGGRIGHFAPVAEICASLAVSNITLERAFRKEIKCTPGAFNRILRLGYCHWELNHSDRLITAIANDFGFSDSSHFIQVYRSYYGITPAVARARMKKEGQSSVQPLAEADAASQNASPIMVEILKGQLLFLEEDQEWLDHQVMLQG